jgi:hypothetical protein
MTNTIEITFEKYSELKNKKLKRAEIAEVFGLTDSQLKKLIAKRSWGVKRPETKNQEAFLDYGPNSCYWAGFLAADGCITDNNTLKLCLHYDDTSHIQKLRNYLASDNAITSNTDKYYRSEINIRSDQICNDLRSNFNITPRKSYTYEFPKSLVNSPYLRDFIRGYFDGDGCISESFSNANSKTATLYTTITGSGVFIDYLHNLLKEKLAITGTIQTKDNNIKVIKYCTKDSFVFIEYMYKDCDNYLDRKYSLYKNLSNSIRLTR